MACRTAERNKEIKKYYDSLKNDYRPHKALEMTQSQFAQFNLSLRRIKDIVGVKDFEKSLAKTGR